MKMSPIYGYCLWKQIKIFYLLSSQDVNFKENLNKITRLTNLNLKVNTKMKKKLIDV